MYLLELGRIMSRNMFKFTVFFLIPLLTVSCVVAGFAISKPSVHPENLSEEITSIENQIAILPDVFDSLTDTPGEIKQELWDAWVAFGGMTSSNYEEEEGDNDIHGAYYAFYHAEGYSGTELFDTFLVAKASFMEFYISYSNYIVNVPKLFIGSKNFKTFTNGVERLHTQFGKENSALSSLDAMRAVREECNSIRRRVNFRQIIENMQVMILTRTQADGLKTMHYDLTQKSVGMAHNNVKDDLRYLDFCNMSYDYLNYKLNKYVATNASGNVSNYYGFEDLNSSDRKVEIKRTEYMLESGMTNIDFSKPLKFWSTMSASTGTTTVDYIFNAFQIVIIPIALLAILITTFCVFKDITNRTILGAVASPNSRSSIILSKLFACYTAALLILAIFFAAYFLVGIALVGTVAPPQVLFLYASKFTVMSSFSYLLLHMGSVALILLCFITLTALFCVCFQHGPSIFIWSSITACAAIITGFCLANYSLFQVIFPIIIVSIFVISFVGTFFRFQRRDF